MQELPLGLGMALAQIPGALEAFGSMPESQKAQVIAHTHQITSKQEMHEYVSGLTKHKRS